MGELILGAIVVFIVFKVYFKIERAILRSKSPVVNGAVNIAGALSALYLAKTVIKKIMKD